MDIKYDYDKVVENKFYNKTKFVSKIAIKIRNKYKCVGQENIPQEGKLIIASNHISSFDPAYIMVKSKRPCHFMAKVQLFENNLLAKILIKSNAFPVDRDKLDRKALKHAGLVLENEKVLGIFPEGTRSKNLKPIEAKNGVGMIALMSKADILPVSIYRDPDDTGLRKKVTVRFGEVIKFDEIEFESEKKSLQTHQLTNIIMGEIISLWEEGHCK